MENKITAISLASSLAQTTGKSRKLCEDFIKEFFKVAGESLAEGESLRIKGFGTFKIVEVDSREGVNIATGERQEIARHKKVVFTPAKEIAETINAPFKDFDSVEMEDEIPEDIFIEPEEEEISDEDRVSNYRLEEGSNEEGEDDEITSEAYQAASLTFPAASENPVSSHSEEVTLISEEPEERPETASAAYTPATEEVAPTPPTYEEYEDDPQPTRFWNGFLMGALSMFAVCAVIFMLGCFFDWWPVNFGNPKNGVAETVVTSVTPETTETATEEKEEEPPVYDTVSTTRYLTTIAREHYGDFNFWPYIYLENQSILGHPDRITPGTQVVVPDLAKYGVDPSNPEDVKAAKNKGAEIYARFR